MPKINLKNKFEDDEPWVGPETEEDLGWLVNRLQEASTWRGIVTAITGLGIISFGEEVIDSIITIGVTIFVLIEVFVKDDNSPDKLKKINIMDFINRYLPIFAIYFMPLVVLFILGAIGLGEYYSTLSAACFWIAGITYEKIVNRYRDK